MSEENMKMAEMMHGRFLNEVGLGHLIKLDIYRRLVLCLEISDLEQLVAENIYFYPIFSPASQSNLPIALPRSSRIIGIDVNTLKFFSPDESVAIILHEIGHALNSAYKGEEGEYIADDYAACRGYKEHIVGGLERGKKINPSAFDNEITDKRINRLK